jgi:hypothetical protein
MTSLDETLLEKMALKYGFSSSDLNVLRSAIPLKENDHRSIFLHELQAEREKREREEKEKREREEKEKREREEKEKREREKMIQEEKEKILLEQKMRNQFASQKQTDMKRKYIR